MGESEIVEHFKAVAAKNANGYTSFLGAGAYRHYRPVIIDSLVQRGEFLTSYTPYQAEITQGTLQAIFEFQTMICELTGMDIANASMYDGSTAAAEAVMMAVRITGRDGVLVARTAHPEYREVMQETYHLQHQEHSASRSWLWRGRPHRSPWRSKQPSPTRPPACSCNRPTSSESSRTFPPSLRSRIKESARCSSFPIAGSNLARYRASSCGGRYRLARSAVLRRGAQLRRPVLRRDRNQGKISAPDALGRLVGETKDKDGRRGFVLYALNSGEQHIRREKATSNICTNQALVALMATITFAMTVYGKQGIKELAVQNLAKAQYAAKERAWAKTASSFLLRAALSHEFVLQTSEAPEQLSGASARRQDHRRSFTLRSGIRNWAMRRCGALRSSLRRNRSIRPPTVLAEVRLSQHPPSSKKEISRWATTEQAFRRNASAQGHRAPHAERKTIVRNILARQKSLQAAASLGMCRSVDPAALLSAKPFATDTGTCCRELSEIEIIRHFTRLSTWNYAIDLGMYPLGSCTMKYNPRVNEYVSRLEGIAEAHPYQPDSLSQGALEVVKLLQDCLIEITGMDAITLQPAAGAHGEFTGILLARAYHESKGNPRKTIIIPDSAHGTELLRQQRSCGYSGGRINLKSNAQGGIDVACPRHRSSMKTPPR